MRLSAFITLFILWFNVNATIINIPADYSTIQDGINVALPGDTVLVQPGTYFENLSFFGKNITVGSLYLTTLDTSYISQTVIDGSQTNSVVKFENMETAASVLSGFTIQNGSSMLGGGGILCFAFSNPTLEHLVIRNNTGSGGGGVMCFGYASPVINDVEITQNTAVLYGGGLYCELLSNPTLNNVTIFDNTSYQDGGGMYFMDSCFVSANYVSIKGNYAERHGGGIGCENNSNINVFNSFIENNSAQFSGGGVYLINSSPQLQDSKVAANLAYRGGGIFATGSQMASFMNLVVENNKSHSFGGGLFLHSSLLNAEQISIRNNIALQGGGGVFCDSSMINFDPTNRSNIYLNFAGMNGNDFYNNCSQSVTMTLDTFTVDDFPAEYQVHPSAYFTFDVLNHKVKRSSGTLYVDPAGSNANNGLSKDQPLKTIAYALTKAMPDSEKPQTIFLNGGVYSSHTNGENFPLNMRDYISFVGDSDSVVVLNAENQGNILVFDDDLGVSFQNLTLTGGNDIEGGAIYCNNSDPFFEHITMYGNTADSGGAVYCNQNSNPYFLNSTITGNYSTNGGAIYSSDNRITIVNSILWDNFPQEIFFSSLADTGFLTVAYSNIMGGEDQIVRGQSTNVYWLAGNLNSDPLFVDTSFYNFCLQDTSPCINIGIQDTTIIYNNGNKVLNIPALVYSGTAPELGAWELIEIVDHRDDPKPVTPYSFTLFQNYPNPFNPKTRIDFILPEASLVTIRIYNSIGQLVETLIKEKMPVGKNSVYFDGSNYTSDQYFYQISAGKYSTVKKMILLK